MTTTTMHRSVVPASVNTPELQDNINRVIAMLQSGIGVEDEGTKYNDLKQLEREVMAGVKSGRIPPEKAFKIAADVRHNLTTESLQRFDEYFNDKNARQNLNNLIDHAADGRADAQLHGRANRQLQDTMVALRTFEGSPDELLAASQHVTQLEGRGELDAIRASGLRHSIDSRLSEMVAEGRLAIAPPPAVWHAFIDSHAQSEAARNLSARVAVNPRDHILDPSRFEPSLRATLAKGNIALSELGQLSAEAAEANRRGQLSTAGRRSIERAIDASVKNANGVLDPAASVTRQAAVAAARQGGVVHRTLGATPSAEALSSPARDALARESRSKLVTPVTVAPQNIGVSPAARAIDATQRPAAARAAEKDAAKLHTFEFNDPAIAQQFVHALTSPGKVSSGQRAAIVDSVLQKGAMSLGELRAFQIALDDAATLGLVSRLQSEQAWRVVASGAAKHVGGATIADKVQAEQIAKHGVQRFRG